MTYEQMKAKCAKESKDLKEFCENVGMVFSDSDNPESVGASIVLCYIKKHSLETRLNFHDVCTWWNEASKRGIQLAA